MINGVVYDLPNLRGNIFLNGHIRRVDYNSRFGVNCKYLLSWLTRPKANHRVFPERKKTAAMTVEEYVADYFDKNFHCLGLKFK